jgi:hypothetical protein
MGGADVEHFFDEAPDDDWQGRPDVAFRPSDDEDAMVVVEFEHWSSQRQAERNIEQAVEWVGAHPGRRVAFVHAVNEAGNVDHVALARYARSLSHPRFQYVLRTYWHDRDDYDSTSRDIATAVYKLIRPTFRVALKFACRAA